MRPARGVVDDSAGNRGLAVAPGGELLVWREVTRWRRDVKRMVRLKSGRPRCLFRHGAKELIERCSVLGLSAADQTEATDRIGDLGPISHGDLAIADNAVGKPTQHFGILAAGLNKEDARRTLRLAPGLPRAAQEGRT